MKGAQGILVPIDAEAAASALDAHEDYRVSRRIQPTPRNGVTGSRSALIVGCALDVETTGLSDDDAIIELAVQRFWATAEGRIVETGRPHSWLEDPGRPLTAEVTAITGLTDSDVRGRSIFDPVAASLIADADFVVAHNASFDRPHVERRLPFAAGRPWVCTLGDVDWRALGFEGRTLGMLLLQMGWFYSAHRASADVTALLKLLDHRLDDGSTVMARAIAKASKPTFVVEATRAPFKTKDALKSRGYRWNTDRRVWIREGDERLLDEELLWLARNVYAAGGKPEVSRQTWRTRHAARRSGLQ